jgi:excisionase family DNA binding protein
MEAENERKTYKIAEAAKLLGISRNKAHAAAISGDIPSIKIGRTVLVPKAPLDRLLAGGEQPA